MPWRCCFLLAAVMMLLTIGHMFALRELNATPGEWPVKIDILTG